MNKPETLNWALNEMTGKGSAKTNLKTYDENKDTIDSHTVFADMLNKKLVNFANTGKGPTTLELKECIKKDDNNDDDMFASRKIMTEVFNTLGNLKKNKAAGIDGVSVEVLKTSL